MFEYSKYDQTKIFELKQDAYVHIRNVSKCEARRYMLAVMAAGDDYKELVRITKLFIA